MGVHDLIYFYGINDAYIHLLYAYMVVVHIMLSIS